MQSAVTLLIRCQSAVVARVDEAPSPIDQVEQQAALALVAPWAGSISRWRQMFARPRKPAPAFPAYVSSARLLAGCTQARSLESRAADVQINVWAKGRAGIVVLN